MYILLDTACSTNVDSGACLINHIKKKKQDTEKCSDVILDPEMVQKM